MSFPNPRLFGSALLAVSLLAVAGQPQPGDSFPSLKTFTLEGNLPELAKGKLVLVDFWASWCGPCKSSFPAMNELHRRYADKGLIILAINVDKRREEMDAFLKRNPAEFVVLRDAGQKLVETVHVQSMPTSFLVDQKGVVRFVHNGFRGKETIREYEREIEQLLAPHPEPAP